MEQKHTPGPWQRFDDGGKLPDGGTYGIEYSDCVWSARGPGYGLVADCSPHGAPPNPETVANARLIAAAPELLEALQEVAELTKRQQLPLTAQIHELVTAAISKAA